MLLVIFDASLWSPYKLRNDFAFAKTRTQISCAVPVTTQLISLFVFASWIVQSLFFLYQEFQASSLFLRLHRLVCVKLVRNPEDQFSTAFLWSPYNLDLYELDLLLSTIKFHLTHQFLPEEVKRVQ